MLTVIRCLGRSRSLPILYLFQFLPQALRQNKSILPIDINYIPIPTRKNHHQIRFSIFDFFDFSTMSSTVPVPVPVAPNPPPLEPPGPRPPDPSTTTTTAPPDSTLATQPNARTHWEISQRAIAVTLKAMGIPNAQIKEWTGGMPVRTIQAIVNKARKRGYDPKVCKVVRDYFVEDGIRSGRPSNRERELRRVEVGREREGERRGEGGGERAEEVDVMEIEEEEMDDDEERELRRAGGEGGVEADMGREREGERRGEGDGKRAEEVDMEEIEEEEMDDDEADGVELEVVQQRCGEILGSRTLGDAPR
ncbi:hypothetical protein DFH27DRAFT_545886 [Peziza echinospora]|nr:hypothetical protein DFH27DRAFT_545886 [Peziza echinospora]